MTFNIFGKTFHGFLHKLITQHVHARAGSYVIGAGVHIYLCIGIYLYVSGIIIF